VTIVIFYSCPLCGLRRARCTVPARQEEDVVDWMEATTQCLSDDHRRRSPHCHPTQLEEVMIPMAGADRIGGPTRH